jgi:hypothetical protein
MLPRRGTGRGNQNASLDAISEPLGDVFFSDSFFISNRSSKIISLTCFFILELCFLSLFEILKLKIRVTIFICFLSLFKTQQSGSLLIKKAHVAKQRISAHFSRQCGFVVSFFNSKKVVIYFPTTYLALVRACNVAQLIPRRKQVASHHQIRHQKHYQLKPN